MRKNGGGDYFAWILLICIFASTLAVTFSNISKLSSSSGYRENSRKSTQFKSSSTSAVSSVKEAHTTSKSSSKAYYNKNNYDNNKKNSSYHNNYGKKSSSKYKMPDCDDYEDFDEFMDDWDGNMPDGSDAEDYWENW